MSKKKSTHKFKLPPINPETHSPGANTLVDKFEKSLTVSKDNVRITPEIDFLVEQQRKEELTKRLEKKRHHAQFSFEKLQLQWHKLEQNELTFQKTIISHNRFLKRNLEKRERALMKIQNDMELSRKRDRDIRNLDQRYDFFNAVLGKLRTEINLHSIYEKYLRTVIDHADSPFKTINEFLAKFEALRAVKFICMRRQSREMAATVELHDDNVEFFRLQDVTLVGLKNELDVLSNRFEDTVRKTIVWEIVICDVMNKCNQIKYEIDTIYEMIDFIYKYICRRRRQMPKIYAITDVEKKFECIKETLAGWKAVQMKSGRRKTKESFDGRESQ